MENRTPKGYFFTSEGISQEDFEKLVDFANDLGVSVDGFNANLRLDYYYKPNIRDGVSWKICLNEYDSVAILSTPFTRITHLKDGYGETTFSFVRENLGSIVLELEGFDTSVKEAYELSQKQVGYEKESSTPKSEQFSPPPFQFSGEVIKFLKDMKIAAREGQYGKVIGRDEDVNVLVKALSRHKKSNALLIGECGVGKTSVVELLAQKMSDGGLDEKLCEMDIYEVDIGEVKAGCKYRGDLEKRVTSIMTEVAKHGNCILFMDELHMAYSKDNSDITNLMKRHLTGKDVKVIGSTTYSELKNTLQKDPAFVRRFQKISVLEPSSEDVLEILKGVRNTYQDHHAVKYSNHILKYIVEMGSEHIRNQYQPDLSINILDLVGVECKFSSKKVVTESMVCKVLSSITKTPVDKIGKSSDMILNLEGNIKKVIFGQDEAVETLVSRLKVFQAGFTSKEKPIMSVLLTGGSGTGKSEVAIQLAELTGRNFLRLDMTEYSEKFSISSLIGSAKGYLGSDEGGVLTNYISRNPNTVILVDESDKAHPEVLQVFLNIMDNGSLRARDGENIDFRNTILLFTSNAGVRASEDAKQGIGFFADTLEDNQKDTIEQGIKDMIAPEFRSRLDKIVHFNPISQEVMEMIVGKFLKEVTDKIDCKVKFSKEVITQIAKDGFSESLGARPAKKIIYEKIVIPLSEKILGEGIDKYGTIQVDTVGGEVVVSSDSFEEA